MCWWPLVKVRAYCLSAPNQYLIALVEDCSSSIELALEILQSCTKLSIRLNNMIIGPTGTNLDETSSRYFFQNMPFKISSAKWRSFRSECYLNCPSYQLIFLTRTAVNKAVNELYIICHVPTSQFAGVAIDIDVIGTRLWRIRLLTIWTASFLMNYRKFAFIIVMYHGSTTRVKEILIWLKLYSNITVIAQLYTKTAYYILLDWFVPW